MTRTKDVAATVLTTLAVVTFAATHESWNVWLVGSSHRWATGAVLLLGMGACMLGSPGDDAATKLLAVLGTGALVLALAALVSNSLTPLSLLVADIVVLWAISTLRHLRRGAGKPLPV